MCVLTYIPTEDNGFLFTSNRDESVGRASAIAPRKYDIGGRYVFFPKDPQGGGTWIGGCETFTLCLLNGGFEKHMPMPPYRQSRGKIILDFYKYADVEKFLQEYDFEGIEPFTLIIVNRDKQFLINEIRWTGNRIFYTTYSAYQARIWSSATLYTDEVIRERENWFQHFLQAYPTCNYEDVLRFHHFGGKGDINNDIKMNRNHKLMTLSITQFQMSHDTFLLRYEDLLKNKNYVFRIFTECV